MKIKTSELKDKALDWAVASAEGKTILIDQHGDVSCFDRDDWFYYKPSTNWAIAGPIIEREIYKVFKNMGGTYTATIKFRAPYCSVTYDADIGRDDYIHGAGDTMLEACMRCYIKHKLGNEVDIPEELLK